MKPISAVAALLALLAAAGCQKDGSPGTNAAGDRPGETTDRVASEPAAKTQAPEAAGDTWVEFVSDNKLYRARFPAPPVKSEEQAPTELGTLRFTMATYEGPGGRYALVAMASEVPVPEGTSITIEGGLNGARDQMVANIGGTLVSERKIVREGIPGRELRYHAPNQGSPVNGMARIFATQDPLTIYQVNAVFIGPLDEALALRFLDSYEIQRNQ